MQFCATACHGVVCETFENCFEGSLQVLVHYGRLSCSLGQQQAPATRVLLKGGGGPRWVGGWGCGGIPPSGDPELLEAPKVPKKFFGLN